MRNLIKIIDKFKEQHILVIGDIMLDEYIFGEVSRISPEAPVPILRVTKEESRLGGAANVANNVVSLGGNCTIIGQVGKDKIKDKIIKKLKDNNINNLLLERKDYKTTRKTRIISKNQQTIRIDYELNKKIEEKHITEIIKKIKKIKANCIIVSDYNKGMITKNLMEKLKKLKIPILGDPKPENIRFFKNCFAITPNLNEAKKFTKEKETKKIGKKILDSLNTNLVLTMGEKGAYLFELTNKSPVYLPTKAKEIYDVSGAGDTFICTVALSFAAGANLYECALIGNNAAGKVVEKIGTSTLSTTELKESFKEKDKKIKNIEELINLLSKLKKDNKKIIFTNGCFDILHTGHIRLLKKSKSFGDVLILGLNTDNSIRTLKGKDRPINNQEDRAEILANLNYVNYIVFFEENTPENLISLLKPDIHVKGGDYDPLNQQSMPEAKIVQKYGGKIKIVKLLKGKSTTAIINKMKKKK